MSACDELGERLVLQERAAAVREQPRPREGLDQSRRQDEITDAQRGKHHLRERSEVEDALAAIERLQRVDRTALEAVLAVVVVLDHVGADPPRPGEQRDPARVRHHAAERILMRRRHVREACTRPQPARAR